MCRPIFSDMKEKRKFAAVLENCLMLRFIEGRFSWAFVSPAEISTLYSLRFCLRCNHFVHGDLLDTLFPENSSSTIHVYFPSFARAGVFDSMPVPCASGVLDARISRVFVESFPPLEKDQGRKDSLGGNTTYRRTKVSWDERN